MRAPVRRHHRRAPVRLVPKPHEGAPFPRRLACETIVTMSQQFASKRTRTSTSTSSADAVARTMDAPDPLDGWEGWQPEEDPPPAPIELAEVHVERGRQARAQLATLSPDAAADERLLLELAAEEVALVDALQLASGRLAGQLIEVLPDSKSLLMTSKALREVVATQCALTRRIEGVLGAASTLRGQRIFLARAQAARRAP